MNYLTTLRSKLTLVFTFILISNLAYSANIAIIESKSFHPLQKMDTQWESLALSMGHTASILTQSSLDDISNFDGFDVLIVSNGLIQMSDSRRDVISQFIINGGDTYIQAEYQPTQPGNETFEYAVTQLGGTFNWTGAQNGNLVPMNISGYLAEATVPVTNIDHFWYGAFGSGNDDIVPFLEYDNKHFGFIYNSPNSSHGKLVTTSDQDWIRLGHSEGLAQNIIFYLTTTCTIDIPSIFVSVSSSQPCENEPVTFTANLGATTATVEYQWLVNNVDVAGATDAAFTSTFNSGDLVHCRITFSNSCESQDVETPQLEVLTIMPISDTPTLTISTNNTTICATDNVTALATPENVQGLNNVSFQWTLNDQDIPGATNTSLSINSLDNGDVLKCLIKYDDPCASNSQVLSNELNFTVNTSTTPTLTINSDFTNICAGEAVDFLADAIDAGSNPTFQWKIDGNNVGSNSSSFSTSDLTNNQVVTCEVTSNDACATTLTATSNPIVMGVSDLNTPTLDLQVNQSVICVAETVTFTATGTHLGSNPQFEWFLDGQTTTGTNNTFTTNSLTNGQSVTCQVTSSESCLTTNTLMSDPIIMEVNSSVTPSITITSDATAICTGGTVTFTATGDNLGTNPTFQWMVDGTMTGNNASIFNTTITNEQTISCIVTATNTCSGTLTANSNEIDITLTNLTLEVMEIRPERCDESNGFIHLEALGGMAPYTYNWDNQSTNTNTLTQLSAGNYSVIVTDVNGCAAELEINIPYIATPQIASVEANQINCNNFGGTAKVVMDDPTTNYFYVWKNADNQTIGNGSEIQNLQEGLYLIEVMDTYGCMVSEEVYIEAATPLQVEILEETRIKLGEDYQLQVLTNATDATFQWKADESLSCDTCMAPTIKPNHTTTYFVTVTTSTGCSATAHVTIQVEKPRDVFVPNAFSPNNDGQNDRFTIYGGTDVAKIKTFQIFDRWGSTVFTNEDFQVNDESQGWDGMVGNKKSSGEVFIYFVEVEFVDGRSEIYKGDVTATR